MKTFWFLLWGMAMRMVVLLAVLGEVYSWVVGAFAPPLAWIGLAIMFPIFGAIAGLGLGMLEGVVLWVVSVLVHHMGIAGDSVWYRRAAELTCVVACILAVALFWGVTFWRGPDPAASVRLAFTRDLPEALILVVGPLLLVAGASWWAARKVVSQYARETAAGGFSRHLGEYHLIAPDTQREWEEGGMPRLRLTLSALLFLAIGVLAIGAVLASEGLLQHPLQLATTMISFGINLTDLAVLLALGGLIVVYFGWRGKYRVGIQIALVIVVAQFALSWLAVIVLAVGRFMSGGD
jgi:hypothetical protein